MIVRAPRGPSYADHTSQVTGRIERFFCRSWCEERQSEGRGVKRVLQKSGGRPSGSEVKEVRGLDHLRGPDAAFRVFWKTLEGEWIRSVGQKGRSRQTSWTECERIGIRRLRCAVFCALSIPPKSRARGSVADRDWKSSRSPGNGCMRRLARCSARSKVSKKWQIVEKSVDDRAVAGSRVRGGEKPERALISGIPFEISSRIRNRSEAGRMRRGGCRRYHRRPFRSLRFGRVRCPQPNHGCRRRAARPRTAQVPEPGVPR
jgi:hypothetical protein